MKLSERKVHDSAFTAGSAKNGLSEPRRCLSSGYGYQNLPVDRQRSGNVGWPPSKKEN